MLKLTNNTKRAFSIIVRTTMTVSAAFLLFAGAVGKTIADEGTASPTRPVSRTENDRTNEEDEKPALFSGDGKFLASLRFWERNKNKSKANPESVTPQVRPPKSQSVSSEQTESSNHSTAPETGFAPEPPPNPYLETNSANTAQGLRNGSSVPSEGQPATTSHVSYSFDTRDWIDTFSPQYEQDAAYEEVSMKTPKTASRPSTVSAASRPASNENNDWNGHATAIETQAGRESAPRTTASVISDPAPFENLHIDLTASYQKRLQYVQTCGAVVVQANFPLTEIASILDEINLLQQDLTRYIGVPEPKEKIELCLFEDQESYTRFLKEFFPRAPLDRRALYVKLDNKPGTLMVQKTKDFEIDLRHEMTHAIIHASIPTVPIWLDEGLAKYFEVPANDRLNNNPYISRIRWNIRLGAVPSLERLVKLETIDDMGSKEYQDSWAWTHFLIHRSPDTHQLLAAYLQMLAKWSPKPETKSGSGSGFSAAGQKVRTFFVQEFLGKSPEGSVPSLKLYLDDMVPNQREMFKEHFGAAEK